MTKFFIFYKYLLILGFIASSFAISAQCNTSINTVPSSLDTINCGESIQLQITLPNSVLSDDFSTGGLGTIWNGTNLNYSILQQAFCSPPVYCPLSNTPPNVTPITAPSNMFWFQGGPSGWLTTDPLDIQCPGTISLDYRHETQSPAPCDGPDQPNEGQYLEYRALGGTWTVINYWLPVFSGGPMYQHCWNRYTFPITAAMLSAGTEFRIGTLATSAANWDQWAISNFSIDLDLPCGTPFNSILTGPNVPATYSLDTITVTPLGDSAVYIVNVTSGILSCSDTVIVYVEQPSIVASVIPASCVGSDTLDAVATITSRCDYTLVLRNYKSGGPIYPGWGTGQPSPNQSNYVDMYRNGNLAGYFTMGTGGQNATDTFPLPMTDGDLLETDFSGLGAGSLSGQECYYYIYDSQMNQVAATMFGPTPSRFWNDIDVVVTNGGTGYNTPPALPSPTCALVGGGGTYTSCTVNGVSWPNGDITSIVVAGAIGYSSVPTITIGGSNTTPATATAQFAVNGTVGPGILVSCPVTNTYTYAWSNITTIPASTTGLSNPNISNPLSTVTVPTQYQVTATNNLNTQCVAIDTISVPGNPGIGTFDFAITSGNPICDDGTFPTVTFELSSTSISAGNFSFDLEELDALGGVINTTGYTFSGSPFSFTLPNPGSGTYNYQASNLVDGNGCSIAVINSLLILTVNQQVDPGTSPSSPINFCPNDPTAYDLSTYILPADPGGNWTLLGIPMASGLPFIFNPLTNVAGVYRYTVENVPCPALFSEVTIGFFTLPPAPTLTNQPYEACEGDAVIPALTAIGTNLTWYDDAALTSVVGSGSPFATGETAGGIYTYYVTETSTDGCEGPATTVILEIFLTPTAPVAPPQSTCFGLPTPALTATGTTLIWYDNAALTSQVGVGNSFTSGQTAIGVYTYYVTETNADGCESPATIVILEIFILPPAPVAPPQSTCFGSPTSDLTATGTTPTATITWYSDAALTSVVGNASTFATGQTIVGVYTYYVTETSGCEGLAATVTLEIFAIPTAPTLTNQPYEACEGDAVIPALTATGTTLTWYDDLALTNIVGNGSPFATGQTTVGVYTYYVTQTNVDGCEGPSTIAQLEILALPAAPVVGNDVACEGAAVINPLTAIGTTLTWYDDPALTSVVGNGPSFATNQTVVGTYTYYVTQTNADGCEGPSNPVTLTIYPDPIIANFTANPTAIAQGNPINLTVDMAIGGTPPFTINLADDDTPSNSYTITIPIPNMNGSVSAIPNVTPVTTYSIISIVDGNNCSTTSILTVPVTVDPYPIIDPFNTADNEICYGTIPSINMTLYQGQVPVTVNYTYNGVTTDEIIVTVGIPVNIPLDTAELNIGTNTIIINSVTDNSGDVSPSNAIPLPVEIIVNPNPVVTFGQDDVICFEEEDAILEFDFLVGTAPFNVDYTMNTIGQTPLSFNTNGTQTYTLNPSPAVGDNTYNLTQVTDDNGCLSELNTISPITIRVNPTPELGITVKDPNPICIGDTSTLFFPVTTLIGPAPSDPYTLDYLSGTTLSTVIVDAVGNIMLTGTTLPILPIVTTDYTLVSVVDNNGCSNTFIDSDQLVVNELPSVNISGDAEICRQDVTKLYFNVNAGSSPWEVYYNINGTPDSITLYNSADSITLSPTITTVYTIDSVSDILCSSPIIDAATITVNQLPEIEVSGGGSVCDDGSEINVIITTTSGTPTFNIEYTVGINSRSASNIGYQYIINTNEAGTYSVTKATDSKDCIAQSITGNATVNINPMPEANITAYPQPANIDNPVIYFIDESMLHVNGVWEFGDGSPADTTLANGDQINHTFKDTGIYIVALEVMTDSGCVVTAYQTIIINQAFKIYIPTAFTPNNDLYNDYFLPIVDGVQEYNLEIYDRFGGTVFMTEKTNEAWDGKQNNGTEYAIAGNYIYNIIIIDFNGKERTYQGAFTLIR